MYITVAFLGLDSSCQKVLGLERWILFGIAARCVLVQEKETLPEVSRPLHAHCLVSLFVGQLPHLNRNIPLGLELLGLFWG